MKEMWTHFTTPHPFQLNTKNDKADIELMLVAVTGGLCDVIGTLLIITSLRNADVKKESRGQ